MGLLASGPSTPTNSRRGREGPRTLATYMVDQVALGDGVRADLRRARGGRVRACGVCAGACGVWVACARVRVACGCGGRASEEGRLRAEDLLSHALVASRESARPGVAPGVGAVRDVRHHRLFVCGDVLGQVLGA